MRDEPSFADWLGIVSMWKWFGILRSAYASWATIFGAVIATIALGNLVFAVLNWPLAETFAWLFAQYRKTFHPPINFLFSMVSLRLPAAAMDALVAYLAMAGVLFRTFRYQPATRLELPAGHPWRARSALMQLRMIAVEFAGALSWPWIVRGIWRNPGLLVVSRSGFHGRLPTPRARAWMERNKVIEQALAMAGDDARIHCTERLVLITYLITLLAAVAGLVCLNGAIERLGG